MASLDLNKLPNEIAYTSLKRMGEDNRIAYTPIRETFENLFNKILYYTDRIQTLEEENKKLKDEHYKDKIFEEKMAEFEKRFKTVSDMLNRGFPMTEWQHKRIVDWTTKHFKEKHPNERHNLGVDYHFYPTEIGTFCDCTCKVCGEKFDVPGEF